MTPSLSETFAPPSTTTYGRSGSVGESAQHCGLPGDETARVVREPSGYVEHAGVLAMDSTEPVPDVGVGQPGEPVGELGPLAVVLGRLGGLEPEVLQEGDLAVVQCRDGGCGGRPGRVFCQRNGLAQELGQPDGHRSQRESRSPLPLGAAEVRADHDARPGISQ